MIFICEAVSRTVLCEEPDKNHAPAKIRARTKTIVSVILAGSAVVRNPSRLYSQDPTKRLDPVLTSSPYRGYIQS